MSQQSAQTRHSLFADPPEKRKRRVRLFKRVQHKHRVPRARADRTERATHPLVQDVVVDAGIIRQHLQEALNVFFGREKFHVSLECGQTHVKPPQNL